jgi:pyruvate/2-oxoglutarate dehydrogenase complex dihydrolipoamide dehydrogenase (E3) component
MVDHDVADVDLLIVGGGKARKSLAMDRAKAGWKVAIAERDKIGGTCINVACIPTKALVGSAPNDRFIRWSRCLGGRFAGTRRLRWNAPSSVSQHVAAHADCTVVVVR